MLLELENNNLEIDADYDYNDDDTIFPWITIKVLSKSGDYTSNLEFGLDNVENLQELCNFLKSKAAHFQTVNDLAKGKLK